MPSTSPQSSPFPLKRGVEDMGLSLDNSTVDVWQVRLSGMLPIFGDLKAVLSLDEVERADKFYLQKDQERFIITRGTLRYLLSAYLGKSPVEISFQYSEYGKMSLSLPLHASGLCFNLSHSADMAVIAMTYGREIGVDVEAVHSDIDFETLAREFFSPAEVKSLLALTPEARHRGFFECWCRKEAYLKARGEGLSYPLNGFTVWLTEAETQTLDVHDDPEESRRWRICSLSLGSDYAGALAVPGHDWELRIKELQLGSDCKFARSCESRM
jgi:4'-phosphopantetheinyl transferase